MYKVVTLAEVTFFLEAESKEAAAQITEKLIRDKFPNLRVETLETVVEEQPPIVAFE